MPTGHSRDYRDYRHLRAAGTSLVLDCTGDRLPRVVHWGDDLGDLGDLRDPGGAGLADLAAASATAPMSNTLDLPVPLSLMPEHSAGWLGTPGLTGHRDGADFSTSFTVRSIRTVRTPDLPEAHQLTVDAVDEHARLGLVLEMELTASGLVRQRATVTNHDPGERPYVVDGLLLALPVPAHATELLDLTGRHLRERSPQRHEFTLGTHLRENRRGRTGTDATLLHLAGEGGFGFRTGEVWGLHVAWSGNHRTLAERTPAGVSLLGGGETLLAGEVPLAAGQSYTGPWVIGSYGRGLDELAGRFHQYLRARTRHPHRPRPVTLNTWEAVYFQQDIGTLTALADTAAEVGAERFVLDDGWFKGRRDDRAGLGDWYVDESVWPGGLGPLVDHVRSLGLEFGLWVEPEMVSPDSDLARAHPEWILATGGRLPPESRQQQVLDLGHAGAYDHLLERLDALVTEYAIDYLKWDHNRDLVEAGHSPTGAAGVHAQTARRTGCWTNCAPGTLGWRSSPARPAAGGSTSASWSAPTASGPVTASTHSNGSAYSAGQGCCCRPNSSGRTSARPSRTPPGAPTRSTSGPGPPCSGTSASSGTSPRPTPASAPGSRSGSPRTRSYGRCCTPARSSTATIPIRRCGCTAWWPPTAPTRCTPWSRRRRACPPRQASYGCPDSTRTPVTRYGPARPVTGPKAPPVRPAVVGAGGRGGADRPGAGSRRGAGADALPGTSGARGGARTLTTATRTRSREITRGSRT